MAQNRRVEFLFAARAEAIAVWLSKQSVSICAEITDPVRLQNCRERIAALPPFVATPVLNDRSTTLDNREEQKSVGLPNTQDTVTADGQPKSIVTGETQASTRETQARETTLIQKNSRVVIDLNEQRVIVGSPVL